MWLMEELEESMMQSSRLSLENWSNRLLKICQHPKVEDVKTIIAKVIAIIAE